MRGRTLQSVSTLCGGFAIVSAVCLTDLSYLPGGRTVSPLVTVQAAGRAGTPVQAAVSGSRATTVPEASTAAAHGATLSRYCVTCHNGRLKTAGFVLDPAGLTHVADGVETWEKVVTKLRNGAMPPPNAARPDETTLRSLTTWIERELDRVAQTSPDPGRTSTFHRLNRVEYRNAVRDLLAVDVDAAALLPGDDIDEQGFDNMADVLTVSPALLDRYLSAARKIARLAIGEPPLGPAIESYKTPLLLVQDDRMSDELPFGSRGGLAFRHQFPVDGDYKITIRLQRNYVNYIRGLGTRQQLDVRIDGARVKRFQVGGEGDGKGRTAPASYAGNIFGDPEWENYALYADKGLSIDVPVKAGPHTVGISFARDLTADEGVLQPRQSVFAVAINDMRDGNAAIEEVTVGGPYAMGGPGDTPSRQRILLCRPTRTSEETACAQKILGALARRAYRRPVQSTDVTTLMKFYASGRAENNSSFDRGLQLALERLLISPDFLFRVERDPAGVTPGAAYTLSDVDLASRLSFFLWSSIPDDALLDLAERGTLRSPNVLRDQVRRMLADDRSRALVENFGGQWLRLRDLSSVVPDPIEFPEFDENLREAMKKETELFVESQLRENRRVWELLQADYTFVNERLARHYGIRDVYGSHFRRVGLDPDQTARRGGLLGHGSLLTVTSYPNRTSPVLRGKWILANIFGTPPPPPPPDVPDLPTKGEGGQAATVRERMARHRQNVVCSVCHAPMDPMGLALENYDAVGSWRQAEGALPIDASGVLPDGTTFRGPAGLKTLLMERREQFVRTTTEKLLSYATGRAVGLRGRAYVRDIVKSAAGNDYRWNAIILGIVESTPFRMRRAA